MKAVYNMMLKLTIIRDVDEIDETLADCHEYASNVCQLICDDAASDDTVATYDIIESTLNVK